MHGPLEAKSEPLNIPALTGLRFVAALMVIVGHAYPVVSFGNNYALIYAFQPWAEHGMTLFFTLSGFVMWINYAHLFETGPLPRALHLFFAARVARLFPLYACAVLLGLATCPLDRMGEAFSSLVFYIFMVQAWIPQIGHGLLVYSVPGIAHGWSISVEAFLYVLFPFLALTLWRLRRPSAMCLGLVFCVLAFSFVVTVVVYRRWTMFSALGLAVGEKDGLLWLTYYSPYLRVFQFAAGCLLAMLFQTLRHERASARERVIVAAVGLVVFATFLPTLYLTTKIAIQANSGRFNSETIVFVRIASVLFASWTIFMSCRFGGVFARILSSRPFLAGGEISYSLYLLHPFVIHWFVKPPQADMTPTTLSLFALAFGTAVLTSVVLARGTYLVIEMPARRWLRRKLAPKIIGRRQAGTSQPQGNAGLAGTMG